MTEQIDITKGLAKFIIARAVRIAYPKRLQFKVAADLCIINQCQVLTGDETDAIAASVEQIVATLEADGREALYALKEKP